MNEGYWRNMAVNPLNAAQAPPPPQVRIDSGFPRKWFGRWMNLLFPIQAAAVGTSTEEIQFRHKRHWGYIYRPYKAANPAS